MSNPIIQPSFNSGEWAPALNARVDLAKYHSGAALLRNFFVDYRGGATTRPGTRYVLQTRLTSAVRIIIWPRLPPILQQRDSGSRSCHYHNLSRRWSSRGLHRHRSRLCHQRLACHRRQYLHRHQLPHQHLHPIRSLWQSYQHQPVHTSNLRSPSLHHNFPLPSQ